MSKLLEIARTGLVSIYLHPLRSVVTVAAMVALLLPYVAGVSMSKGLEQQAELSIQGGADLYVSGSQFGRHAALPVDFVGPIKEIEGVLQVVPRIVGRVTLGVDREEAVLVGIDPEHLPASSGSVQGRLYGNASAHEFVIGTELASRLKLQVGSLIPPFYRNPQGERVSKVVGIFRPDAPLWQARLIFTSFEAASTIFDQPGRATDLLVYCRPGYSNTVARSIERSAELNSAGVRPKLVSRSSLEALLPRGAIHRKGVFNLHFVLAFSVGILVLLVTTGFGLSERRHEISILKAIGWQTDEILLRGLVESFLLSLLSASVSVLLAFIWLKWLNGFWIASVFLAGAGIIPSFEIPFRFVPVPLLLSYLLAFVLVMSGTTLSCWRSAMVPPLSALR